MGPTASIYSIVAEDQVRAEASAWTRFSTTKDQVEFCASWLAILCAQIERVGGGLLLLGPDVDGGYTPFAVWPDISRNLQHLGPAAELTLRERRGVVLAADGSSPPTPEQHAHVGYPIEVAGTLRGAVVLDLAPAPSQDLQRALRLMHWASAWLVDLFRQRIVEEHELRLSRVGLVMDLAATAIQDQRFAESALAVVNELAARLNCDRVSIGMERSSRVEVKAISHTATFDRKMRMVRLIGNAMDEVLDLDTTIVHPGAGADDIGAIAHAELAREFGDTAVCSVPLQENGQTIGVLTFERTAGLVFDAETVEICKLAGTMLGPILQLKQNNDRGVVRRIGVAVHTGAQALFGPRHPGVKLMTLLAIGVVAFLSFATGQYRVSSKALVEGAIQRAAVAPFDGYIAQSFVHAGDSVQAGQVLCQLDDRNLRLEYGRFESQFDELWRKHRQAIAAQDRATILVVAAQIRQVEAELELVKDKLSRVTLRSPFDGIVVSGDLRQLLGTPVEQGKVLFQIAPLHDYRVILQVDERDVAHVKTGQTGELALEGLISQDLAFEVQAITPVSSAQDGRNFFRVEAKLENPSYRLRPGMEGVGKISIDQRRLIWIWTHSLVDWMRTWLWEHAL
ncbi:MAG: HlyD family efflux transporter periplasmic adaptor subunit [Xanthobacteraceae bacterium]